MNGTIIKRGRPHTYDSSTRQMLAALIREHGARRAREVSPIRVSLFTLLKIAREFRLELKQGRRPNASLGEGSGASLVFKIHEKSLLAQSRQMDAHKQ